MQDNFHHGLMLGRVLELSEKTAAKVDVIEGRQQQLLARIGILETKPDKSPSNLGKVLLAAGAAITGGLANLKAEDVARVISALLGSP